MLGEASAVVGNDLLSRFVIRLTEDTSQPDLVGGVSFDHEWSIESRGAHNRLAGDGVDEPGNRCLTCRGLRLRLHVDPIPGKVRQRGRDYGEALNETSVVRAQTEEGANLGGRVDLRRIEVLHDLDLLWIHAQAFATNHMAQVLGFGGEEDALAGLHREARPS